MHTLHTRNIINVSYSRSVFVMCSVAVYSVQFFPRATHAYAELNRAIGAIKGIIM